ncbi:MAG: chorismate synthase [Erysipelotrichaceae bacterium]|nr:chorismate synthase [Erysipelotrichaceae bacterium]
MKNVFGNNITYTLFGESHGPYVGIVIDGLPAGLKVDEEYIEREMAKRRAGGSWSTSRREADIPQFVSGVKDGYTEGTPVAILIPNNNVHSADYADMQHLARPGHADYTAECKYDGFQDVRGGGHFSGRLTAAIVAAGAIVRQALEDKGILIGTHVRKLAGISDRKFENYHADIEKLNGKAFAVLDEEAGKKMAVAIEAAKSEGDSLGAVLETAVIGLEAGIGEPTFDSLEGVLAHGLFAVGGIKGVSFGAGFDLADMKGSQANDIFRMKDGEVIALPNNNGGINGGISNGMPIIINCAVKPTSSISMPQKTVDYKKMENAEICIQGRHDPVIAVRARAVVDAIVAMCLAEMLVQRYGYQWLRSEA